jgi:hypothetical protein
MNTRYLGRRIILSRLCGIGVSIFDNRRTVKIGDAWTKRSDSGGGVNVTIHGVPKYRSVMGLPPIRLLMVDMAK